jgi:Domain of unknown function (DUF4397)
MKTRLTPALVTLALGLFVSVSALVTAAPAASAAPHGPASSGYGWIRLAHLSPNAPAVDAYLYSFGSPHAMIVLKHVSYGTVSPYEKVRSGEYTVAMRGAGAKPSSPPVLSTSVAIAPGAAYTVAGMGPASGLRLRVLRDDLTTPRGKSLVRVIQASLLQHAVTVTAGPHVLVRGLTFAHVSSYVVAPVGRWTVHASGTGASTSSRIMLSAGSIHTLVVLDSPGGLKIADLEDAAGSGVMPEGGPATGLGGTAPVPASSPAPWLALAAAGALLSCAGAYRLRKVRL